MSILYDLDDRTYHARPELSSTQARLILDSPARYKWSLTQPPRTSDSFDVGHAVHAKVLGIGAKVVIYPPEHLTPSGNVSEKAATVKWIAEQRAKGLTPITEGQQRATDSMAEAILAHAEARALLEQPGNAEASVFARCDETGIDLRARFDYLPDLDQPYPIAVDLKTTGTRATAREFARSVHTYGYYVQQGHYLDTLRLETGRDDIGFRYVVVEKNAPHHVAVHQLDDLYADIGTEHARQARRTLRECLDSGIWPTGLEDVQYLDAPSWLIEDDIQIGIGA